VSSRTLIRGGSVLTLGVKTPNFDAADVLIDDGRVAEVGRGLRARDAELVDASDTIVMPGFVDTHRHVWKSLFRNLDQVESGGRTSVVDTALHQPEDVYAATLVGLLGAVEAGITTVVDWADLPPGHEHSRAALEAHRDSGLRTVFVTAGLEQRPELQGSLTTIAFGSPDLTGAFLDRLTEGWASARAEGLRIHVHAGLPDSPQGLVANLWERGLLGEDVTLIHCSSLRGDDLDAVASSGASVSLTPPSEMAGGLGSPPTQELIDRGVRPGLGVDSEGATPGDMFAPMRATISMQHAELFDLKLAGKGGLPNLLSTREVIRYGTLHGARVAGLGDVTGSLEPGKQADLIVLRADRPNITPVNDPIGAVVWGMDTSNLDWVFVGGKALMRGGELAADVARARALAGSAQERVVGRASRLLVDTGGAG